MFRFITCVAIFTLAVQCQPTDVTEGNIGLGANMIPGYKRASLLELNSGVEDIVEVAPFSAELQQRYQIEHADESVYIEPEGPISSEKALRKPSKMMKLNLPGQIMNDAQGSTKKRLVIGMDGDGEVRVMQVPQYSRDNTWEQQQ